MVCYDYKNEKKEKHLTCPVTVIFTSKKWQSAQSWHRVAKHTSNAVLPKFIFFKVIGCHNTELMSTFPVSFISKMTQLYTI